MNISLPLYELYDIEDEQEREFCLDQYFLLVYWEHHDEWGNPV
ncbi:hypothetical protein VSS37_06610 [Candidatus Thiothrix sp. Deng01]|uniref:Uncharacterized protein n=1 Tax=Candidatus Thiothrix phosphatis TaxID=3112415 RepID=A0ABU6CX25_9GAMM|nr:hypothetical protein [Candidatus Thiothrix sp. Deng01]MEB4590643.1 hypothetical protein [Candidatus Thiothrix sp. Deng01]